ncbi:zinc-ribbon domain-containing protein [Bacillus toyonensis]|uniref:zinc-ribbon domain-containing protein n=1 Tax=Bacillus toyonensis TaxID=155322 RepID=UPI0019062D91|nr:zinc-ribbon domain-containing protein [Bacillus toyonensis]QQN86685.1 zinc-ribbon domain-containing protein [Bacillus toyonensis]
MNSLAYLYPEIAMEWHPTRNDVDTPISVSQKSKSNRIFRCLKGHYFPSTVYNKHKNGCPFCANKKIGFDNCIAALYPQVAYEWDPIKNSRKTPLDVTRGNGGKAYFNCTNKHSTYPNIRTRTSGVSLGCTECSKEYRTSFIEQAVYFYVKKVFPDTKNKFMHSLLKETNSEIDVFTPKINLGIEVDGHYYHKEDRRNKSDADKNKLLSKDKDLKFIRIKELPKKRDNQILGEITGNQNVFFEESDVTSINRMIKEILDFIKGECSINKNELEIINKLNIDINRDEIHICDLFIKLKKSNNLKTLRPEVAKQWHPTRNGNLKPEYFHPFSNHKVWWKCSKGHFWNSSIGRKANCVFCLRQRAWRDNNLSYINPDIALTFHRTRNGVKTPLLYAGAGGADIYWICAKGHYYQNKIFNETRDYNCPYCALGNKLYWDKSLAFINPQLAMEWHQTRNSETPLDKGQFSHSKVYWKCRDKGHFYDSLILNRSRGAGCTYCTNKKNNWDNNVSLFEPILAFSWHLTRNKSKTPCEVGVGSHFDAMWKCEKGDNFQSKIYNRIKNYKCSYCSGKEANRRNNLAFIIPQLAFEWNSEMNGQSTPMDFKTGSNKRFYFKNKPSSINSKVKNFKKVYGE